MDGDTRVDGAAGYFVDDRGIDRRLKVTWHARERLFVLSIWQGNRCAATFRLPVANAARLVSTLVDGIADAATTGATKARRSAGRRGASQPRTLGGPAWRPREEG